MDTTRELFPNVSDARSRQRLRKLFFVFPGGKCPPGAGIMYLHSSRCIKRAAVPEHPLRRALYLIRILRSSKVKCRSLTAVSLFTLRAGWFTSLSLSLKIQLFFVPHTKIIVLVKFQKFYCLLTSVLVILTKTRFLAMETAPLAALSPSKTKLRQNLDFFQTNAKSR